MIKYYIITAFLSLLPVSELRGAIPFAFFNGIPLLPAFLYSTLFNLLVPFICYLFLNTLHKLFYRWNFYKVFFDKTVTKTRSKISGKVDKYGLWGLMLFVAIPLPITGAWTASLGAWILGLDKKRSILAISLGVLISGLIVSSIIFTGVGINSVFIKQIKI